MKSSAPITLTPDTLAFLVDADSYPGIDAGEVPIVRAWLRAHGDEFDVIEFNPRVGFGRAVDAADDEATRRMWQAVTAHRPDVIARRGETFQVIEAKRYARVQAVTQVMRYTLEFATQRPDVHRVEPAIICGDCDVAVERLMVGYGGTVEKFGVAQG